MLVHKQLGFQGLKVQKLPNVGLRCAPKPARGPCTGSRLAAVQVRASQEQFGLVSELEVSVAWLQCFFVAKCLA
jgi:hypothetical protein